MIRIAGLVRRAYGHRRSGILITSRVCVQRSYATVIASQKILDERLPSSMFSIREVDRIGLRRYLDIHRLSSMLHNEEERLNSFDSLWELLLSRPEKDISLVNKYLFSRIDCGVKVDCDHVLRSIEGVGLKPNTRTFGAFIHQSCSNGNMEETSVHLQALKQANLKPDLYIFSQILHGYIKAGCPEEVISTKEIMARMGLWPSRQGYEGILSAYAEMGNRAELLSTLNESWEYLSSHSKSSSAPDHFLPQFIIQLYVKLICAEPRPDGTCAELLSRLPIPVDPFTRSRAREGTKRLLAHGRLTAAQELFKRADPESADDSYLLSLPKYLSAGGIDPQAVSTLWEMADVTGSRLSMLRRQVSNDFRRQSNRTSVSYDALHEAFSRKDVDAVFELIKNQSNVTASLMYNYVVPRLVRLGVSPTQLLERLEPATLHPAAAFGCVIASLSPSPESGTTPTVDFDAVAQMLDRFLEKQYLPTTEFIQLSGLTLRQMVQASQQTDKASSQEQMAKTLELLGKAVTPHQLKAVVSQLFEHCLSPFKSNFKGSERQPSTRDQEALQALVDACVLQDIKFPPNHWIFYNLENCAVSRDKIDQLKLPPLTGQRPTEDRAKPMSMWKRLHALLLAGDVESAINAIKRAGARSDSTKPSFGPQPTTNIRFPDPVAIACEVLQETRNNPAELPQESKAQLLTGQDVERLFWASWDGQILPNALRAISQVASAYNKLSDFKGMAEYFSRASKQLGAMQDTLLMPAYMRALLKDNFTENLSLLKSMISSPYISTATFANTTCLLEDVLTTSFPDELKNLSDFQRDSKDYWPTQVLAKRFQGISHLQKLRTTHLAIEDLCKSNNLFAAHSLRMWAHQLGLLIFPKTNELLVLTPYLIPSYDRQLSLPSWCMSHELSQHFPVNLDHRLLTSLDALVLDRTTTGDSENKSVTVKSVANWLVDHISADRSLVDSSSSNWLPTWLVVSQRLHQTGSKFTDPQAYTLLAIEFLRQASTARLNAVTELDFWFAYAPTPHLKAALVLAALSNTTCQNWGLEKLRSNPDLLCTIAFKLDPSAILSPEQQAAFTDAISKLGRAHTLELVAPLQKDPLDVTALKLICDKFPLDELADELATYVLNTEFLLKPITTFLQECYPNSLVPFFDQLLAKLSCFPRRIRAVRFSYEQMQHLGVDISLLKPENQAFLYGAYHVLNAPRPNLVHPLDHLSRTLPPELQDSWLTELKSAIAGEDFINVYELLKKLDPALRDSALSFVTYTLPGLADTARVKKLMITIAEHMDGQMLMCATNKARPFLFGGLGDAYLALARVYNNEKIDWYDRACIRYHKLGPLLQRKTPETEPAAKMEHNAVDELTTLLKQPISSVVQTILKVQSEPEKLNATLTHLLSGWSPQRKSVLLSYLIAEGATDAVEGIANITADKTISHSPSVEFAKLVKSSLALPKETEDTTTTATELAQSALEKLVKMAPKDVNACLRGPHVELLFRIWPSDQLGDLLKVVNNASERERTSLHLQLAAIMINRNRHDLVKQLIKTTGPLPTTFLAGSPRHILSEPELQATLTYLSENDPDHVTTFVDTCVRNAVSTTNPQQKAELINFVRAVTSSPHSFNLPDICLLPTVNLISDFLRRTPKLPNDIKDIFKSVIDRSGARPPSLGA